MAIVLFALVAIFLCSQSAWAQCCESGGGNGSRESCLNESAQPVSISQTRVNDACCHANGSAQDMKNLDATNSVSLDAAGESPAVESDGVIASASPYRISRPAARPTFEYKLNETAKFQKWKDDYGRPVVCPVLQCHGGCAKTDLGCKGIYNSLLGSSGSCCESAPPAVRHAPGVFKLREVLKP